MAFFYMMFSSSSKASFFCIFLISAIVIVSVSETLTSVYFLIHLCNVELLIPYSLHISVLPFPELYKLTMVKEWKCRPHQDSVKKFKHKLKELTCRKMPGTVTSKIAKINQVTRGWINYYALGSMKTAMTEIDAHLRTRIRIII